MSDQPAQPEAAAMHAPRLSLRDFGVKRLAKSSIYKDVVSKGKDSKISDIVMTMLAKNKANLAYTEENKEDEKLDPDNQTGSENPVVTSGKESSPDKDADKDLEESHEEEPTSISSGKGGQDAKHEDLIISHGAPSANNNPEETHIETTPRIRYLMKKILARKREQVAAKADTVKAPSPDCQKFSTMVKEIMIKQFKDREQEKVDGVGENEQLESKKSDQQNNASNKVPAKERETDAQVDKDGRETDKGKPSTKPKQVRMAGLLWRSMSKNKLKKEGQNEEGHHNEKATSVVSHTDAHDPSIGVNAGELQVDEQVVEQVDEQGDEKVDQQVDQQVYQEGSALHVHDLQVSEVSEEPEKVQPEVELSGAGGLNGVALKEGTWVKCEQTTEAGMAVEQTTESDVNIQEAGKTRAEVECAGAEETSGTGGLNEETSKDNAEGSAKGTGPCGSGTCVLL